MLAILILAVLSKVSADNGTDCFLRYNPLLVAGRYVIPIVLIVSGLVIACVFSWFVAVNSSALTECKWYGKYPIRLMTEALGKYRAAVGHENDRDIIFYTLRKYAYTVPPSDPFHPKTEARYNHPDECPEGTWIPMSMPYLFKRLQLQWYYVLITAMWISISTVTTFNILVLDCRGGGYWQRIALVISCVNIVYILVFMVFSYILSKRLLASTLLRGIYEVMCRSGMFKVSKAYMQLEKNSTFIAKVHTRVPANVDHKSGCHESYGRPIYYLDNIEGEDVHFTWMTSQERTLFAESTDLANRARREITKGQNRLLVAAGSAAIASLITVVTAIDSYGTSSALYALASTFSIAVFAQTMGAYIGIVAATSKNDASTRGIVAVNRDVYEGLHEWAVNRAKDFMPLYYMGKIIIKEEPYTEDEVLGNPYRFNNAYKPSMFCYATINHQKDIDKLEKMTE
jgi:hypothetical protein